MTLIRKLVLWLTRDTDPKPEPTGPRPIPVQIRLDNRAFLDTVASALQHNIAALTVDMERRSTGACTQHANVKALYEEIKTLLNRYNHAEALVASCYVVHDEICFLQQRLGTAGVVKQ